jgi:hypothetical protein
LNQSVVLFEAIVNQNIASVNILIFAGSNLEIGDADGNTPLMIGIKALIKNFSNIKKNSRFKLKRFKTNVELILEF